MVMQRHIQRSPMRITQNTKGVTLSAGSANVRSLAAEFVVPDKTGYVIAEGQPFSVFVGTDPATPVADTAQVELVIASPNGRVAQTVIDSDYVAVKEFQDNSKILYTQRRLELEADQRLQLYVTGDLAFTTANTRFQIGSVEVTEVILQ